jgi:hypothetical protein
MTVTTTITTPHIPLPPGFVSAGDWQASGADMPYRLVYGANQTSVSMPNASNLSRSVAGTARSAAASHSALSR